MSVHSICFVQYQTAVEDRCSGFCLIAVGRLCNPFFFSCAHRAQVIVRIFLRKLEARETSVKTGGCAIRVAGVNYFKYNCFK